MGGKRFISGKSKRVKFGTESVPLVGPTRREGDVPVITLTTDFGLRDHYVSVLKGVILSIAPQARLVDVTHEVPKFEITHGAFILRQIWSLFPAGTIHLAVVDPGVGTDRRIVIARYDDRYAVVPDNGLLSFVHRDLKIESLHVAEERRFFADRVSDTFQGRDVMAPVAAHLAKGVAPREFGRSSDDIEILDVAPRAASVPGGFCASVLYIDAFGTLVTNLHADQLGGTHSEDGMWRVWVGDREIGSIHPTFAAVPAHSAVALIGSSGYLEIAINQGRAVERFGPEPSVRLSRKM